jgi:hypothetical protein
MRKYTEKEFLLRRRHLMSFIYRQARALYRLRHVRRQENLSKSEALQEEKLRRERLRAVEVRR